MAKRDMSFAQIHQQLAQLFPNAHCELIHHSAYELSVAVMLSAQTTDKAVNQVTPKLFARFPTVFALAEAEALEVVPYIKTIGLFRNKSKSLVNFAKAVVIKHQGHIPDNLTRLMALPGIGRKSANVILSVWFKKPALAVDTHVERVSKRLGLAKENDTVLQVEKKLMRKFDRSIWSELHHQLIFFGRYFCKARNPLCQQCPFSHFCKEKAKT